LRKSLDDRGAAPVGLRHSEATFELAFGLACVFVQSTNEVDEVRKVVFRPPPFGHRGEVGTGEES
jgi:hypothetical protein